MTRFFFVSRRNKNHNLTQVTPRWYVDSCKQFTRLMMDFTLEILSAHTLTLATICYCCRNAYGWDLDVYDVLSPESQAHHTVRKSSCFSCSSSHSTVIVLTSVWDLKMYCPSHTLLSCISLLTFLCTILIISNVVDCSLLSAFRFTSSQNQQDKAAA